MTSRACQHCGTIYPAADHCPNHPPQPWRHTRTAAQRGYDSAWRRIRARVIREQPTCAAPGCTAPTTEVDHIIPLHPAPGRLTGARLERGNLQGLCHHHHVAKTKHDKQTGATR